MSSLEKAVDAFMKKNARKKFVICKIGFRYTMFRDLSRGGSKGLNLNPATVPFFKKHGVRVEILRGGR